MAKAKKIDAKKLKKLGMKPKTIADLRKQQRQQRAKLAVGQISREKMKELEQKQAKKAISELSKEQEKLGTERQKRLGMAEELRNLYPELSDTEFNTLLKSQFGINVPLSERAVSAGVNVGESVGGRRTKKEIEDFKKAIQSANLNELMEDVASNPKGLTVAQLRDIQKEIKDRKLQSKAQAEAAADEPLRKRAEEEKQARLKEIAQKAAEEQQRLEELAKQEALTSFAKSKQKFSKIKEEQKKQKEQAEQERLRVEEVETQRQETIARNEALKNEIADIRDEINRAKAIIQERKKTKEYRKFNDKEPPKTDTRNYRDYLESKRRIEEAEQQIEILKSEEQARLDILGVKQLIIKKKAPEPKPQLAPETPEEIERRRQLNLALAPPVVPPQIQALALNAPPQTVVQQVDPDTNINAAQAQVDAGAPVAAGDGTGAGLNRKYAIHPYHIKEGKNKYILSSKAKKHVKNLYKLFPAKKVESIINFSLLNKARNDRQGLTAKFKAGKAVKGYEKEKVSGGNIYYKL